MDRYGLIFNVPNVRSREASFPEPSWLPSFISGGYWLSSDYGLTMNGSNVASWQSRGELSPGYTARTGSALTVDADGVYFPAGNADFLYESSPIAKTDDHTVFGVIRPKQSFSTNGVIIGRYKTSTNERSWQVAMDSLNTRAISTLSSNGTATVTTAVSPIGLASNRCYAFVVRKTGTAIKTFFRSIQEVSNSLAPATLSNPSLPTTIGGRGGTASADGSIGWNGWIKHLGFYNRALTDQELNALLAWLQVEEQQLIRGSAFGLTAASYQTLTRTNTTVIAPDGNTPVSGTPATHRYRHHVAVGANSSGRLWLSHSSGAVNEDSSGQQLHLATSNDNGDTWSSPIVMVSSIGSFGGVAYGSGSFIAFSRCFVTWQGSLYCVAAIDKCGTASESSYALTGAALVACECKPDGTIGSLFRIDTDGLGYSGAPAYDATLGPPIYTIANRQGIWGGNGTTPDAGGGSWSGWVTLRDESGTVFTEMSAVHLGGLKWMRILRCVNSANSAELNLLWSSVSIDDGVTWSSPSPTDVPNAPSSAVIRRLSDGRFAVIGNPQNATANAEDLREKLAVYLFDSSRQGVAAYIVRDGLGTSPVYAGTYKSGGPAYPGFAQSGNQLIVGYSVWKERVDVTRLTLP